MGILTINIIGFALPGDAYVNPLAWGGDRAVDLGVWAFTQVLLEGRMRGLFAMLFGAGVLMLSTRGERPVRAHYARMAVLALFGLAHGYLVWNGDILLHYAVLGCLLPIAWDWDAGRLARAAIVVLALHTALLSIQFGGALYFQSLANTPDAPADLVARYQAMVATFPHAGSATVAADLAAYRGTWADAVGYRWFVRGTAPLRLLEFAGGESLGYMLTGMALYRAGALTGEWSDAAMRRMMVWGYALGLPGMVALTAWGALSGFDPVVLMGNFLAWSVPFRVATSLGHLALILWLARRFTAAPLIARGAAAGRMAFTNYLATSIVMTAIFYGHGLRLYGQVPRAELYLFVAAMWVAMLVASPWCLARFGQGPVEWLWRRLSGGTIHRKSANATQ